MKLTTLFLVILTLITGCGEENGTQLPPPPPIPAPVLSQSMIVNSTVGSQQHIPIYQSVSPLKGQLLSISSVRPIHQPSSAISCPQPQINGLELIYTQSEPGVCMFEYTVTDGTTKTVNELISSASLTDHTPIKDINIDTLLGNVVSVPIVVDENAGEILSIVTILGDGVAVNDSTEIVFTPSSVGLVRIVYSLVNESASILSYKIGVINITVSDSDSTTELQAPNKEYSLPPTAEKTFSLPITNGASTSQLISVIAPYGTTATPATGRIDAGYFTNKDFTFSADSPGVYHVFYTAHDHQGHYRTGIATMKVEGNASLFARDASFFRVPSLAAFDWNVDLRSYISTDDIGSVEYISAKFDDATSGAIADNPGKIIAPTQGKPVLTYKYPGGNATGLVAIKYTVRKGNVRTSGIIFIAFGIQMPELTSVDIYPMVKIGVNVTASSDCTQCDASKTTYEWTLGHEMYQKGKELLIPWGGDGEQLVLTVTPYDTNGLRGARVSKTFKYRIVIPTMVTGNYFAFAVLKNDGTVVTWGDPLYGGNSKDVQDQLVDVKKIIGTKFAFAALKNDGTVVTWGLSEYGGNSDAVQFKLTDIQSIKGNDYAFAAIKNDGTVVTWGDPLYGGYTDDLQNKLVDVKSISYTKNAFAAILNNGKVVTWGDGSNGGDSSDVQSKLINIKFIAGSERAFAAIKYDGTAVAWGDKSYGGNIPVSAMYDIYAITDTNSAFAAVKLNGTVRTWGLSYAGGDSGNVQTQLIGVKSIVGNYASFAALKNDGTIVTWGRIVGGGNSDDVQTQLIDVKSIVGSYEAFAALKVGGRVVTWGESNYGGDSGDVQSQLVGVKFIASTSKAFAAILEYGKVVTWGDPDKGGDSSGVINELYPNVIYPVLD